MKISEKKKRLFDNIDFPIKKGLKLTKNLYVWIHLWKVVSLTYCETFCFLKPVLSLHYENEKVISGLSRICLKRLFAVYII